MSYLEVEYTCRDDDDDVDGEKWWRHNDDDDDDDAAVAGVTYTVGEKWRHCDILYKFSRYSQTLKIITLL